MEESIRGVASKERGPDELPAELIELSLDRDQELLQRFHHIIVTIWQTEEVPQQWKDAPSRYCSRKTTDRGNNRGHLPSDDRWQFFLKLVATRLSNYREREDILPEEPSGLRRAHSTYDIMLAVRRFHEVARKESTTLYACLLDLPKAYVRLRQPTAAVDRAQRFGVRTEMQDIIRQLHDGMRAYADGRSNELQRVRRGPEL